MSGMYTMLPLTQVLKGGERRDTREKKETGIVLCALHTTGAGDK